MGVEKDVGITEMTSFEVDRVDAVGSPANGTPWLLLKAVGEVAKRDEDPNTGGGVDRDKLPAKDFAGKHRSFPIVTPGDVSDAASSIGRAGSDNFSPDKLKANIIRIAKRKGPKFVAQLPASWRKEMKKMSKKKASKAAPDATGVPTKAPAASEAAHLPADGKGDSLGSQNVDPKALEGQTMENCTPPSGTSDQQSRQDSQTQKAHAELVDGSDAPKKPKGKKKRHMHNPQHADDKTESSDSTSGVSAAHEDKDVAIGKRTVAALQQALGLAQEFTHREESEAADASTAKGIDDMTKDELAALLTDAVTKAQADAKAQAKADKKAKAKAKMKAKAKAAKKAAKAEKSVAGLEERLANLEGQPARNRPVLSGAKPEGAFKALQDQLDVATASGNVTAQLAARERITKAKAMVLENAREQGVIPSGSEMGPNVTPMLTPTYQIPDDTSIRGV